MAKNPRIDPHWQTPIRQSVGGVDFGISLARVPWEFFVTPTFRGSVPRPSICYGMIFRWLQEIAKVHAVPYSRVLIGLRGEEGEQRCRFHFHCLVGGTTTRNNHSTQFQMAHLWKVISGNGRIDVRQYDRTQAGAEYVAKCLGANAYELNKYSFANSVTLSASVIRLIASLDERGERRCGLDNRKNGRVLNAAGHKTPSTAFVAGGLPAASRISDETASLGSGMGKAALAGVGQTLSVGAGRPYEKSSDGIIKLLPDNPKSS